MKLVSARIGVASYVSVATKARDFFTRYRREDREPVRTIDTKQDKVLERFIKIWQSDDGLSTEKQFVTGAPYQWFTEYKYYTRVQHKIKRVEYTKEDIRKFCIALADFQEEKNFDKKAGIFLSVLINNMKEDSITITTSHLSVKPCYLGYRNIKNISIDGDVDYGACTLMKKGSVIVRGNTGNSTGEGMDGGELIITGNAGNNIARDMKGGLILVKANVGYEAGESMEGGKVIIEGNADYDLGRHMEGGEIHIYGDPQNFACGDGGKIFHKGKEFEFKNGMLVPVN